MATKIKRKIFGFGEFKKNTLAKAEKHTIKDDSIKESNVWSTEQKEQVDKLDDEFEKAVDKAGIERNSKKAADLWISAGFKKRMEDIFCTKEEAVEEAKKEKVDKEASIFKRNILDFKKFKDGKDTVQKEKLKPIKENEQSSEIPDHITIDKHCSDLDETRIVKWMHDNLSNKGTTDLTGSILTIITKDLDAQDYKDLCNYLNNSLGFDILKENEAETVADGKEKVFQEFKNKESFSKQELCAALKKEYPHSLWGDIDDMAETLSRALENYKNPDE